MPFFSKVFKSRDDSHKKTAPVTNGTTPAKKQWSDAWLRTRVDPEEVAELLHACTREIKSRGLDIPFLLLPFRPSSDPSAARTFVRNYFFPSNDREQLTGDDLTTELRMITPMVIISVMKWCWARLPGGVVTWETYEVFKVGETDCSYARDAFNHFIPIGVESKSRVQIIRDFFELLAAIAAHGKTNGLSAYKLSRYAGWWAFNHIDTGKGFDAGYKSWENAADASTHLFFAYLRSVAPRGKNSGVLSLPRSLQQLLDSTQYPPGRGFISNDTTKLVMIVEIVSPTPYALLRRAKNFEYRDSDHALQEFSNFDDPIKALTDECRRVLSAISSTNEQHVSNSKTSTSLSDPSWSRFEDIGFGSALDESDESDGFLSTKPARTMNGTHSAMDLARPTTPSWADFLSSGFDEHGNRSGAPVLLPPDKILPPLHTVAARGQSSQSHRRNLEPTQLDPGELASINAIKVDDAFWWVWISSLAGEEPQSRKAVFGRCALIETIFSDGRWMVMEEQVKGAAPEPAQGAYIAEKKRSFFGFTTKGGRLTRRRSGVKKSPLTPEVNGDQKPTIAPDQQARIQQATAELSRKKEAEEAATAAVRKRELPSQAPASNRNSVFTLGPNKDELTPALQWAKKYDKEAIRAQYLGNKLAGTGSRELLTLPEQGLNRSTSTLSRHDTKELPIPPRAKTPAEEWPSTPPVNVETPRIVEPAPTPPEPTAPVEPVVEEAKQAPLPTTTPWPVDNASKTNLPVDNAPKKLRKSQDGGRRSPEDKKKAKIGPPPVQKTTGIRRLFGTKRSKSKRPDPAQAEPESTDPAIVAARAALEGKPGLAPNGTDSPPLSPNHFAKLKTANPTKPTPAVEEPRPATPPAELETAPGIVEPKREEMHSGPPRTRRDDEYDQLSRVDTNEREDADKEFSKFDQGPLVDQPAFAPEDSPIRDEYLQRGVESHYNQPQQQEQHHQPGAQHQSVYSQVTAPIEESDEEEDLQPSISATDRWAQIRKNAAERARQSEEQTSRSRTETNRTDDGETSGEETIESRVARIKARVAELTGNMEATRR